MPESSNVIENNDYVLLLGGPSESARKSFYQIMENRVQIVDDPEEYSQLIRKMVPTKSTGAHVYAKVHVVPEAKVVAESKIYVNKADFVVNGEDYTDLIPVVIRHEVAELYIYAKRGYSMTPIPSSMSPEDPRKIAHGLAVREQMRYAKEIGKAERFMEFVRKVSVTLPGSEGGSFYEENQDAYDRVMREHGTE